MSNGDRRSVSTDALETLGKIIDDTQKRDAIHLAVEPVIAGEEMDPGAYVDVVGGVARLSRSDTALGIVDPFLESTVRQGQRFWFVMKPRQVHSLRHVWTHPAFPDEPGMDTSKTQRSGLSKAMSEKWLRDFCTKADCPGYEETIAAAVDSDDDTYLHISGTSASGEIPDEFWDHVENVTGRKGLPRASFFSCSC